VRIHNEDYAHAPPEWLSRSTRSWSGTFAHFDFGTDLRNPSFAKMAEAAGLLGLRAETPEQIEPMIAQALQHDGPALVEVIVSLQELSMPPITVDEAKGFSLFMQRAVLSGRGDELIDLAKTNLLP
jgi:pyruvate dehydrogenase (quinone)